MGATVKVRIAHWAYVSYRWRDGEIARPLSGEGRPMNRVKRRTLGALGLALMLAISSSAAQEPKLVRVRGTIEKIDGDLMTVKARDGTELKLKLRENASIRAIVPAKLSDIGSSTNVGITSIPQPDGSLRASELRIFPTDQSFTSSNGPWDSMPNSSMTNGSVQTSVAAVDGQVLTVTYKTGDRTEEKKIKVTPQTIITRYEPAPTAILPAGSKASTITHRLYCHRYVAVTRDEDDRNFEVRLCELS